jgi:hypothetical protein
LVLKQWLPSGEGKMPFIQFPTAIASEQLMCPLKINPGAIELEIHNAARREFHAIFLERVR